jgi:hypothetical protein
MADAGPAGRAVPRLGAGFDGVSRGLIGPSGEPTQTMGPCGLGDLISVRWDAVTRCT